MSDGGMYVAGLWRIVNNAKVMIERNTKTLEILGEMNSDVMLLGLTSSNDMEISMLGRTNLFIEGYYREANMALEAYVHSIESYIRNVE